VPALCRIYKNRIKAADAPANRCGHRIRELVQSKSPPGCTPATLPASHWVSHPVRPLISYWSCNLCPSAHFRPRKCQSVCLTFPKILHGFRKVMKLRGITSTMHCKLLITVYLARKMALKHPFFAKRDGTTDSPGTRKNR
jgi:hypothetical protein